MKKAVFALSVLPFLSSCALFLPALVAGAAGGVSIPVSTKDGDIYPEPVIDFYEPQQSKSKSKSESIGNVWRVGAQITHGSFDIFTTFDDPSSEKNDWMGLALNLPFNAGVLTSNNLELGFNGNADFWLGNQKMTTTDPYSDSTLGLAIQSLDVHARMYTHSIQDQGFFPWGQISVEVIEHFKLGTGLDDAGGGLVDTSLLQLKFVEALSFDVSVGASYRFAEAASFDFEVPILRYIGSQDSDSLNLVLFNYDAEVLFGFSIWM